MVYKVKLLSVVMLCFGYGKVPTESYAKVNKYNEMPQVTKLCKYWNITNIKNIAKVSQMENIANELITKRSPMKISQISWKWKHRNIEGRKYRNMRTGWAGGSSPDPQYEGSLSITGLLNSGTTASFIDKGVIDCYRLKVEALDRPIPV